MKRLLVTSALPYANGPIQDAAKVLLKEAIGAYVERVYEDGDFVGPRIGA